MSVPTSQVVRRVFLPDQLADAIAEMIISGQLQPGERLRQEKLASELGVSRTPLREALLSLERAGLVTLMKGRGVEVTRFDAAEFLELYEVRGVLDGLAAKLAARNITPSQLTELKSILDGMDDLVDRVTLHEWLPGNVKFHGLVVEASHNRHLQQLLHYLQRSSQLFHRILMLAPQHVATTHGHHRRIYEAIAAGDAEAAESSARLHILSNSELVRQMCASQGPHGNDASRPRDILIVE